MKNAMPIVALCLLLLFTSARQSQQSFDKITVREFELVDAKNVQRASIKIEDGGEVVLRLFDQDHTIRVKIGGDTSGSGLVMLDANTNPGVQILSKKEGGKVNLQDPSGKKKEL